MQAIPKYSRCDTLCAKRMSVAGGAKTAAIVLPAMERTITDGGGNGRVPRVSYSPAHVAAAAKAEKGGGPRRKSRRLQCGGAPSTGRSVDGARLLQVVAFMTKEASDEINACGYSCHGCGVRGGDLAVGTLNQGGRMNPWCIKCFMEKYSSFHIDATFHVPHRAVMYVDGIRRKWFNDATVEPISTERYLELRVTNRDVGMRLMLLDKPPGWGCKEAICDRCEEVNSFFGTWIPEVKAWYGEKKEMEGERGGGSCPMEGPAPSTPSGVGAAGATGAAGALQLAECENMASPGTVESDTTLPYEGELPATGAGDSCSGATLDGLSSNVRGEIGRLLDNLEEIMRDIVRDRFWEGGTSTVPNQLLSRFAEAEGAIHNLRRKMGRVDVTARALMEEEG